jgi:hypothetical protein
VQILCTHLADSLFLEYLLSKTSEILNVKGYGTTNCTSSKDPLMSLGHASISASLKHAFGFNSLEQKYQVRITDKTPSPAAGSLK